MMKRTKIATNLLGRVVALTTETEDSQRRMAEFDKGSTYSTVSAPAARKLLDEQAEIVAVFREDGSGLVTVKIIGGDNAGHLVDLYQEQIAIIRNTVEATSEETKTKERSL